MKKKYCILVYKTNKPFKPEVLYNLLKNECDFCFDGFDSALYCCRLAFNAKYRRINASDFLTYYDFKYEFFELTPESLKKSKGGGV